MPHSGMTAARSHGLALLVCALPSQVLGHGMLTMPMARQMIIGDGRYPNGVGLTNPGWGECGISEGNGMNMNGCQGAVAIQEQPANMKPAPHVGVCGGLTNEVGDVMAVVQPPAEGCERVGDGDKSCVEQALRSPIMSKLDVDKDGYFETRIRITAHHWGWSEFRLCTEGEGRGSDGKGVTQECFNKHVLSFDFEDAARRYPKAQMSDTSRPGCFYPSSGTLCKEIENPSDYATMEPSARCDGVGAPTPSGDVEFAPGGSCCVGGGKCDDPDRKDQTTRWVFPKPTAASRSGKLPPTKALRYASGGPTPMDGEYTIKLKMPEDAVQACKKKVCTLQWLFVTGNSPSAYPEAFRNCADFRMG